MNPLVAFFGAKVVPMLTAAPELRVVAIFEEMQRRHLDLSDGARRTLERRIRAWRAPRMGTARPRSRTAISRRPSGMRGVRDFDDLIGDRRFIDEIVSRKNAHQAK